MKAPGPYANRRDRVAYRLARGIVADVLAELGVAQDESTAVGVLDKAVDVEYRTRSRHGEAIVITFPLDDGATGADDQQPGGE